MKKELGITSYFAIEKLLKQLVDKNQQLLCSEESLETYNFRVSLQNLLIEIGCGKPVYDKRFKVYCEGEIDFTKAKTKALEIIREHPRVYDVSFCWTK